MYTSFAEVYDQLMGDVDYQAWARSYAEMMAGWGVPGGRVCECACGTGSLTIPLQRLGYTMTGIDQSQEMLWIASNKAREAVEAYKQRLLETWEELPPVFVTSAEKKEGRDDVLDYIDSINKSL